MQKQPNRKRERDSLRESQPKSSRSDQRPPRAATSLKQPPPSASIEKAQETFKNFSLSKHAKGSLPANHVLEGQENDPTAVRAVQKTVISRTLKTLNHSGPTTQGMTLDVPVEQVKNLLPSYDEHTRTVQLSDVLGLITKKMSGTEFYSVGNPTLNRLALQSRVNQIMQSVKQEATKDE